MSPVTAAGRTMDADATRRDVHASVRCHAWPATTSTPTQEGGSRKLYLTIPDSLPKHGSFRPLSSPFYLSSPFPPRGKPSSAPEWEIAKPSLQQVCARGRSGEERTRSFSLYARAAAAAMAGRVAAVQRPRIAAFLRVSGSPASPSIACLSAIAAYTRMGAG